MFGIDTIIGDFIGSLSGGGVVKGSSRGGKSRPRYNIGNSRQAIGKKYNEPWKKSSGKDKYIQDANDVMRYGGSDRYKF